MLRVCENVLLVVRSVAGPSTTFICGLRLVLPSEDFMSTFVFSVGPTAFSMFLFSFFCLFYLLFICLAIYVYHYMQYVFVYQWMCIGKVRASPIINTDFMRLYYYTIWWQYSFFIQLTITLNNIITNLHEIYI